MLCENRGSAEGEREGQKEGGRRGRERGKELAGEARCTTGVWEENQKNMVIQIL